MLWLLLLVTAVTAVLILAVSPGAGSPSRLRLRTERLTRPLTDRRRRRRCQPDPFEALRLQIRLGVVAGQVRQLESDDHVFARAHRLRAAMAAYDDLLAEACRMAGVQVDPAVHGEQERLREEVELAARGWSW